MEPVSKIASIRWLPCVNNSSSTAIPAFGLVRVVSCDSAGVLTVDQPNADSQDAYVAGPVPILASGKGICTRTDPIYALYDTGDGTPALGEAWGAANGSYKLRKNSSQTGWIIHGGHTSGRVYVRRAGGVGSADEYWLHVSGATLQHLHPSNTDVKAVEGTTHNSGLGIQGIACDDAGHILGWWDTNSVWTSPWGEAEP